MLQEAVQALTPHLEVRSRRVGGATYQVPVEVPGRRARTLAIRWLVGFSRERREKVMAERLAHGGDHYVDNANRYRRSLKKIG